MEIEPEGSLECADGAPSWSLRVLLFAQDQGCPPGKDSGEGRKRRTLGLGRQMPFSESFGPAAHDGNIEFIERNGRLARGALVGLRPSQEFSIQLFHKNAPTSPSATKNPS